MPSAGHGDGPNRETRVLAPNEPAQTSGTRLHNLCLIKKGVLERAHREN